MEGKTWMGIDKRPLTDEFHLTMDNGTTPSSGWIGQSIPLQHSHTMPFRSLELIRCLLYQGIKVTYTKQSGCQSLGGLLLVPHLRTCTCQCQPRHLGTPEHEPDVTLEGDVAATVG